MNKLGKFDILKKIGQGSMGVVYKARDPSIGRIVALKTLTTGLTEDANLLNRFYSEARAAGGLQHPNIVTIYELGHEGNTPFIVMQFLNGESLDKLIARRPNIPLSQKIGFIVHVCRALDYAHKQNPSVVHRDIKPGNVMVTTEGSVMVVDFGIARLGDGTRSQSAGMLIGTLAYMAPQLFGGGSADARSDIWATGVMLYELLVYKRPFDGDTAAALISSIIRDSPQPISKAAPDIPSEIAAVLDRMLCKDIADRYQSMDQVLMDLERPWRRLQETDIANLVATGQELFEGGHFANALDNLRRALQIDTTNTQAKSLLEKINAEIRRSEVIPQLKVRVDKARGLFAAGQFEDALAEAEAIVRVDSTFEPARELLEQAQIAIERANTIAEALRASRQRLAEGALTDAENQLNKVLEMDPANTAALDLSRQIRAEKTRREFKKRRDEILYRGRNLWSHLQYEKCIDLLVSSQPQFPDDPEISKLLETARQDLAEQQRQAQLAEVRNLGGAQRFDEALRSLDTLLERYPADIAATNLRNHILRRQEQQTRELRLKEEKSKLQAWLKAGKYQEVVAAGEKLAKEFSDDFEFHELLDFARTEQFRLDKKHRLEVSLEQTRRAIKENRFFEAIQYAQKALGEFSQNADLLSLLERAKKELNEKEKLELLKQRLKEVESKIQTQELTDAIDLARQTLTTIGPHAGISDILHKAEREFEFRENKKRDQERTFQEARNLIDQNDLTAATETLTGSLHSRLFTQGDPRLTSLLQEIDARQGPRGPGETSTTGSMAAPPGSFDGPPNISEPATYVYQQHALPQAPALAGQQTAAPALPSAVATGSFIDQDSASTALPTPSLIQVVTRIDESPKPGVSLRPEREILRRIDSRKVAIAASAVLALATLLAGIRFFSNDRRHTLVPTSVEIALQKESQDLRSQGKFDDAGKKDGQIVKLNRGLAAWAKQDLEEMQKVRQRESALFADGKAAEQQKDYRRAQQNYQDALALRGPQQSSVRAESEALDSIMRGEAAESVAQKGFERGLQAFAQRDYQTADEILRECLTRAPEGWSQRPQVQSYLAKIGNLISQADALLRAQNEFAAMQYQSAKVDATESANFSDGDPQTKAAALKLLRKLRAREEQRKLYDQASGLEGRGQLLQARNLLNRVSSFADADNALAEKAKSDAARISEAISAKSTAAVRDIDEAIKQGQFDAADARLKDVPSDQNDYARLKSAIAEGRKEDTLFDAKALELEKAEAAKDQAALKDARDFFAAISSRPGRRGRQAEGNVSRIDLDLKKFAATSQPTSRPPGHSATGVNSAVGDLDKINQLKSDYTSGFQNKNILLLRHIWPSITDKKVKEYDDTFKIAESIQWSLDDCGPPAFHGDTATLKCTQDIQIKPRGGELQHKTDSVTLYLQKHGSDWTIARVDAKKMKH